MGLKRKILISLLLVTLVPIKALAGSVKVELDCPASAGKNSEVTCTVSATSADTNLAGIQFNYDIKEATYKSFTPEGNWTAYSNSNKGVSLGIDATTKKVTVGSLKVAMGTKEATISLTKIQGTNNSYETLNCNNVTKTISIKSDDNTLQSLSIEGVELNPKFDSNVTKYTVDVESNVDTIKIDGKANGNAKVKGLGTLNVKYGKNTYNIEVTSETGVKKTYTITVTRKDDRSDNNNLKSLSIDQGTLNFNKKTISYNIEVGQDITKIEIKAEVEDEKATFVNKYGPRSVDLKYGENKIEIKVQAENEKVKVYTINVTRKDERSENANLKNITLSKGAIIFDPNVDTYDVTVKNDVKKLEIKAETENDKAIVEVEDKELVEGLNTILITVIAENGVTKIYTINVTKLKPGEGLSDNNNIKKLEIKGHDIAFDINNNSYTVKITNENELEFNIQMEDETATYEIKNNRDLKNGSVVKVFAKSESGNIKEYDFTIEKDSSKLYIILGIILAVLLIFIVLFILFARKKNNKPEKKVLMPEEII